MTDEQFDALKAEWQAAKARASELYTAITAEANRRAAASCKFAPGDEIAMQKQRYGKPAKTVTYCVERIEESDWKHPRLYGRIVRKDGSLGSLVREIWGWETKASKVGHRDLQEATQCTS